MKRIIPIIALSLSAVLALITVYFFISPVKIIYPCSCGDFFQWRSGSALWESIKKPATSEDMFCRDEPLGVGCSLNYKIFPVDLIVGTVAFFILGIGLRKK